MFELLLDLWGFMKVRKKFWLAPIIVTFVLLGALYNMALSAGFVYTGLRNHYANYMGIWGNTNSVFRLFEKFSPFLRYNVEINGNIISKPIPFLYMIPGFLVFYVPVWILMSLPFMNLRKRQIK